MYASDKWHSSLWHSSKFGENDGRAGFKLITPELTARVATDWTTRACPHTINSVCIPRDIDITNATADRNILLRFRSKNKGNFFISSSLLMKHGAVYAAYRALSPVVQRSLISLISGLVSSNTSMNLFSKLINIANSRSIIKTVFCEQVRRSVWKK